MFYLILCILCNVLLAIIFKSFAKYKVDNHNAIVINYAICVITASLAIGSFAIPMDLISRPWFPYALILSLLFITGFNILASSFQKCGVALTIIIQKMSLILPIIFAVTLFGESMNFLKIGGVVAAIGAIVLVNYPSNNNALNFNRKWLILPLLTFVMSGMIEIDLYYVEVANLIGEDGLVFTASAFGMAGMFGLGYTIFRMISGHHFISKKEIIGGIILGVPNFLTIYLLLVILKLGWEGSVLFPVSSVGTLLMTALVGIVVYKESVNNLKVSGLLLATLAIALIGLSQI